MFGFIKKNASYIIKVRTQNFSEKFRKYIYIFLIFLFLLKRSFQVIFSSFKILL